MCITSLQISRVLGWLGIKFNEYGLMRAVSSHTYWVFRWSGILCIQFGPDEYKDIFIDTLKPPTSIFIWKENEIPLPITPI